MECSIESSFSREHILQRAHSQENTLIHTLHRWKEHINIDGAGGAALPEHINTYSKENTFSREHINTQVMELVVLLYLLDNDTSFLVLFTVGGTLAVNLWKVFFPLLLLFISPFFFEIHIFLCYFFNLHFYFVFFCSVKFYFYFFIKWCRAVTKLVRAWTLFLRYFSFLFNFLFIYIYINFT
jgi:hypothetical protein